jgi:15-cis-phytoene synthase
MPDPSFSPPQESLLAVRDSARAYAFDYYLAALLAPRAYREDLIALAAFTGEIERVPLLVSEPALGEIRIKWWLDWLDGVGGQARSGNPVADVLGEVIRRRQLPVGVLAELVEARALELYAQPFADKPSFHDYLFKTSGASALVAAQILGRCTPDDETAAGLRALGCAYGAARQLLRLPHLASRGRWGLTSGEAEVEATALLDADERQRADARRKNAIVEAWLLLRKANESLKGDVCDSFRMGAGLPAALAGPYLTALERQGDWLTSAADISPLKRVWRLWRARRTGRL